MTHVYTRVVSTPYDGPTLYAQIDADAAITGFDGWNREGTTHHFLKATAWSGSQQTALDLVVANHTPPTPPPGDNPVETTALIVQDPGSGAKTVTVAAVDPVTASYAITLPGAVGGSGQVLQTTDAAGTLSWTTPSSGDVVGPGSATDNAIATFDSTTGKLVQDTTVLVENGGITLPADGTRHSTWFGDGALNQASTGTQNVAFGRDALAAVTSGDTNTAVGNSAMLNNAGGDSNTALGSSACRISGGSQNTVVGADALWHNSAKSGNTALGYKALNAATSGADQNTAVGCIAMQNAQGSSFNTALGYEALGSNTTGASNVAVGWGALKSVETGPRNIAVGYESGKELTLADQHNIMIGHDGFAGSSNTTRIGTVGDHTSAYIAGIHGVTPGDAGTTETVVIDEDGHLGSTTSSGTATGWAEYYMNNNTDDTDMQEDRYYVIEGDVGGSVWRTAGEITSNFTLDVGSSNNSPHIQYTGTPSVTLRLTAVFSWENNNNSDIKVFAAIFKNGANVYSSSPYAGILDQSVLKAHLDDDAANTDYPRTTTLSCFAPAVTSDFFDVRIMNTTDDDDILVRFFNFNVQIL